MRIYTKREKTWLDLVPSFAISWYGEVTIYIGWLFWNVSFVDFFGTK